jgi:hypothetical protein
MIVNRKSSSGKNDDARRPHWRASSASKGIDRWEDEGGNLAPRSDGFDLKNSTLADNAGWRADRRRGQFTAAGPKPK